MHIIEPCCARKDLLRLRDAIGKNGTTVFEGFGDLSLTELLPALLTRYTETSLLLAAPSIPDQAADILRRWMNRQWARMDGKGKIDVISRLFLLGDLSEDASPEVSRWIADGRFADRLDAADRKVADYVILLPDLAILGFRNLRYDAHFTATITAKKETVEGLWATYLKMAEEPRKETKAARRKAKEQKKEEAIPTEAETKPVETETKPAEAEIKPVEAEIKPVEAETKAPEAETRPAGAETPAEE